jgi:hypothetical protein
MIYDRLAFNGLLSVVYLLFGARKKANGNRAYGQQGRLLPFFLDLGAPLGASAPTRLLPPVARGLSCELLPSTTRQFFGLFLGWLLGA